MRDSTPYKAISENLLNTIEEFIKDVENNSLTNEQWFLDFEDALNKLSVKY